jgi:hypothetical protein
MGAFLPSISITKVMLAGSWHETNKEKGTVN